MTLNDYNQFCASLAHTSHVIQWGGAHVWKVAGKVFAIAGWGEGDETAIAFKCSPFVSDMLRDQKGFRPAPYLASRGMSWIQCTDVKLAKNKALKGYLKDSYQLVSLKLPKKVQRELRLNQE